MANYRTALHSLGSQLAGLARRASRRLIGGRSPALPTSSARWVLLAGAVLVLGPITTSCLNRSGDQQPAARAPVPVKVVQTSKGDIAGTLSYPGEVQSMDQVSLLPSISGRVQDILMDEGMEVTAGTVLAQLETDMLEAQVRQADANVQIAQARLDTVLQGARPEEVAASKAMLESLRNKLQGMINGGRPEQVAAIEASYRSAQAKYADIQAGTKAGDLAAAQAAMDIARANVASTETRLRQLKNPTAGDIAAAQAALDAAASGTASARQKLAQLQNPAQADIDATQVGVDSAQAALKSAQAKLDDLKATPKPADLAAAQAAVQSAESTLRSAESTLASLRQTLNTEKLRNLIDAYGAVKTARDKLAQDKAQAAPAATIAADEDALNAAYRKLQLAEEDANTFRAGVTAEQIIAAQAAVDAARGSLSSSQAKLAQLLAGPTSADLQSAQAGVDTARANLQAANLKLERLKNPLPADIAAAQAGVEQAESQRAAAQLKLDTLKSPTPADIAAAQTALDSSRASLESSQAKLDQLKAGATAAELEAARAAVVSAEQNLATTRAPFTATDIAAQQALVDQATQQLAMVEGKYTRADIASATAGVAQAEASLELNRIQLSKATLVAPFDALVSKKHVSKGAMVSSQTPLFSLVSKELHIVVFIEEGSIGKLKAGLPVTFTTAALGEQSFRGKIASIAPTADPSSRTFKVTVLQSTAAEDLRAGMFANVSIALEERKNVLLVPREALVQQGNNSFVYVVEDGQADQRKIEVGLTSDRFVQIQSGLVEGDKVVVQGNRTLRPQDQVTVIP